MQTPRAQLDWALAASLLLVAPLLLAPQVHGAEPVDFNRDIRPILFSRCVSCHGPDGAARKGGLRLDTEEGSRAMLSGGIHAILPGDVDASELLDRVRDPDPEFRMPPAEKGDPLSVDEIGRLERWIAGGADYARHWAWEPPVAIPSPDPRVHPIDAFIAARARAAGVSLSPPAERTALIRRLTLDLTGLPPTIEEIDAFLADTDSDAWERLVERTLASPHFGERWASVWLDLARYADTRGYEADRARTMWPWRDLLIRALDTDQPFDEFTIEQLAGDLLTDPTEEQLLATAFHRNTMTNDEGGTDDEEFRVAAVLDRVDTTMQVWMGLTAGCAQCHDHKYDPISHREYYALAAFFDQTEDADRNDEAPTLAVESDADRARLGSLQEELSRVRAARARDLERFPLEEPPDPGPPAPLESLTSLEVLGDGRTPVGADLRVNDRQQPWPWRSPTDPRESFDTVVESRAADSQISQVFFDHALFMRPVSAGDRWGAWVWLDPADPPDTIMLQVHTRDSGWAHRAVWGADQIGFGVSETAERRRIGDLPPLGEWTPVAVPIGAIGIAPPDQITGLALTQRGGHVEWASVWHESTRVPDPRPLHSFSKFVAAMRSDPRAPLPADLRAILSEEGAAELAPLREYFLTTVHPEGREQFLPSTERIGELDREIAALRKQTPRVPVMRQLAAEKSRETHVLRLGNFLMPEDPVTPATPAEFPALSREAPTTRLGLARWLVSPDNPLTARVQVNRVWEQIFGRGLVETVEDFGTQGMLPSHPALLDHLALRFIEGGWRWKPLLRHIVTSETYRRSATSTAEQRSLDPRNELLARSPRTRLPAEQVRDQALAIGGILSPKKFGPPVFPPQPAGVWQVVYNGANWRESEGEDRRRRAIYTYWRRTSPYPSALTLDATSREVCSARRIRSSTPLQALVTMNDPVFLEAAGGLARQMASKDSPDSDARSTDPRSTDPRSTVSRSSVSISAGFRRGTARHPSAREQRVLENLFATERAAFAKDTARGDRLLTEAKVTAAPDESVADLAALIVVGQVILQLDEVWTRP